MRDGPGWALEARAGGVSKIGHRGGQGVEGPFPMTSHCWGDFEELLFFWIEILYI